MWRAWFFLRNNLVFGSVQESIMGSAKFLDSYWESLCGIGRTRKTDENEKGKAPVVDGLCAEGRRRRIQARVVERKDRWEPPRAGWVKINSDAGFCSENGMASAGVVARDHEGSVLLTAWKVLRHCNSPDEAEAEACLYGLRLAADWIRQPTIVESDCQQLITAVRAKAEVTSHWGGVIQDIQAVSELLPSCDFVHVKRGGNVVAHLLARRALQHSECIVSRFSTPACVRTQCAIEAVGTRSSEVCNSVQVD
jgi:ribonuclease HI